MLKYEYHQSLHCRNNIVATTFNVISYVATTTLKMLVSRLKQGGKHYMQGALIIPTDYMRI